MILSYWKQQSQNKMDNYDYNKMPAYINLYASSDSSLQYHYENKGNSFTVELVQPIESDHYVIGLKEIYYGDSFENPSETETTTTTTENPITLWFRENTQKEDSVKLRMQNELLNETRMNGLNFTEFLIQLDKDLTLKLPKVKIKSQIKDNIKRTILIFEDFTGDNYVLEMQPELAEILGFQSTQFNPGKYTSPNTQNQEAFTKYNHLPNLWIRIYKFTESEMTIGANDDDTLDDVLTKISDKLKIINFFVSFVVSPDGRTLYVEIDTPRLSFQLPNYINTAIGKTERYFFSGNESIVLPIIKPENEFDFINVICNLTELSQCGSNQKQVLRIFERKYGINKRHVVQFSPVQYFPLRRQLINNLQIKLETDSGDLIPETKYITVAVVVFKKI